MVSLARRLPLLLDQSFREGRALEHQDPRSCHDDWLFSAQVSGGPYFEIEHY